MDNDIEYTWNSVEESPKYKGRYLVVQQREQSKYRWVRYWTGKEWYDNKIDIYGEITHWMNLPKFPKKEYIDNKSNGWDSYYSNKEQQE